MDWDELEQEMVKEGPDVGTGLELGQGLEVEVDFTKGDFIKGESLLELDKEPSFDSYEEFVEFREKNQHLYLNGRFVGSKRCKEDVGEVGEVRKKGKRRSSEEVSRDLIGRFVVDLSWVPCRSTVDRVFSKELNQLWCVKSLVVLRDKGVCRICGDRVRGNTWKVVKLIDEDRWGTENCYLMCSQCAMCKGSKYFEGSGVKKMKSVKRFVLKRRRKGYGGCKRLSMYGLSVLKALLEEESKLGRIYAGSVLPEQLVNMPKR